MNVLAGLWVGKHFCCCYMTLQKVLTNYFEVIPKDNIASGQAEPKQLRFPLRSPPLLHAPSMINLHSSACGSRCDSRTSVSRGADPGGSVPADEGSYCCRAWATAQSNSKSVPGLRLTYGLLRYVKPSAGAFNSGPHCAAPVPKAKEKMGYPWGRVLIDKGYLRKKWDRSQISQAVMSALRV